MGLDNIRKKMALPIGAAAAEKATTPVMNLFERQGDQYGNKTLTRYAPG